MIYNDRFHLLRYFAGVEIDESAHSSSLTMSSAITHSQEASDGVLSKSREKSNEETKKKMAEYSHFLEEKDTFALLVDTEKVIQSMEQRGSGRAPLRKKIPTPTSFASHSPPEGTGQSSGKGDASLSSLGVALRTRTTTASKYFALGDGDYSSSPSHPLPSPSPQEIGESPLLLSLEDKRMAVEMEGAASSFSSSSSSTGSSSSVLSPSPQAAATASLSSQPKVSDMPTKSSSPPPSSVCDSDGTPLVILLGFISSHVRSIQSPVLRRMCLDIFSHFAPYVDDECRLQHLLPYTVTLLSDSDPMVRVVAIRTLTNIVSLVETFPSPTDADVFPEYLIPSLSPYVFDKEEIVRVELAGNLARLAEAARSFLEKSQFLKHSELLAHRDELDGIPHDSYDAELLALQNLFLDLVTPLLSVDRSPAVKQTILRDITRLCIFFGGATTNHFLLPLIITFLNEAEWGLRSAFFQHIPGVATFVGMLSLERFILPCLYQVLSQLFFYSCFKVFSFAIVHHVFFLKGLVDEEEHVIEKALSCLSSLCELSLFRKHIFLEIISKIRPLLFHPNSWIRSACVSVIVAGSSSLDEPSRFCFLLPMIRPFLTYDCVTVTDQAILDSLLPPLSRSAFSRSLVVAYSCLQEQLTADSDVEEAKENIAAGSGGGGLVLVGGVGGGVGVDGGDSLSDDFTSLSGEMEAKKKDRIMSPRSQNLVPTPAPTIPSSSTSSRTKNFSSLFSRKVNEKMSDLAPLELDQILHLTDYLKLLCPILASRKRFREICW